MNSLLIIKNIFQKWKQYHNMTRDEWNVFFQIYHSKDKPVHKQHKYKAAEKRV